MDTLFLSAISNKCPSVLLPKHVLFPKLIYKPSFELFPLRCRHRNQDNSRRSVRFIFLNFVRFSIRSSSQLFSFQIMSYATKRWIKLNNTQLLLRKLHATVGITHSIVVKLDEGANNVFISYTIYYKSSHTIFTHTYWMISFSIPLCTHTQSFVIPLIYYNKIWPRDSSEDRQRDFRIGLEEILEQLG